MCTAPTPPDEAFATEEEIAQYEADLAAYQATLAQNAEIVAANKEYLASPEVRAKRQARVSQLLLEEEILEGMFEGYRFYDLLRYQMQEQGGTGIGTVISASSLHWQRALSGYSGQAPGQAMVSASPKALDSCVIIMRPCPTVREIPQI